jgi:3-carboxy-cis,cis-muconate cycloisomerase
MLSSMRQEHERGLGGWQAEWETLPEIFMLSAGALRQMDHVIAGLHVDADRMQSNLELTRGLVYAEAVSNSLSQKLDRTAAHQLVEDLCRKAAAERRHLRDIAAEDAEMSKHFTNAELAALFDPQQHVRAAARMVDRALAALKSIPKGPRRRKHHALRRIKWRTHPLSPQRQC